MPLNILIHIDWVKKLIQNKEQSILSFFESKPGMPVLPTI